MLFRSGYGYNIEDLHNEIGKILGLDKTYSAVLIGAGNLGQAIANYSGFRGAPGWDPRQHMLWAPGCPPPTLLWTS